MKLFLAAVFMLFLSAVSVLAAGPRVTPSPSIVTQAHQLIRERNFLAFRVLIKKGYQRRLTYGEWYALLGIINSNSDKVGFDLVFLWNARNPQGKSGFDKTLEYADSLMLAGSFGSAFDEYQKMATFLKKQTSFPDQVRRATALYPFVIHSMARALYGAGRYSDALVVYRWIRPSYVQFRQVLFERMWAAFRVGRVEEALGAVASQRSAYFSRFLSPEGYLIQTYIYKKLCRTEDLEHVTNEMKAYEQALGRGDGIVEWAGNSLETRVLFGLANQQIVVPQGVGISAAEIATERDGIKVPINRAFQAQKARILNDLKTVMAYSHLVEVTDSSGTFLKPIEKLTSRQQLMSQDLEIWPVDGSEEWADEIGNRFFVGDSKCVK